MKQFLYRTAFAMHFRESLFELPGNSRIFVAMFRFCAYF